MREIVTSPNAVTLDRARRAARGARASRRSSIRQYRI
ncbi:hypothetical protein UKMH10_3278 [Burkholderia pseudomallei]|nr:hypothetical protein UKMH10_3278 [Burkholderia pseudomallei]